MNIVRELKVADALTIGNLCCGILALFAAHQQNFDLAISLIFIALVLDTFDGKVATWLHQSNKLGKELDSLCDLVSFGVAPAFFYFALQNPNPSISVILIFFVVCGMLRLARYNVSNCKGFKGVPITVNGVLFPLLYLLSTYYPASMVIWPFVFLFMGILMVSSFRVSRII